MYSRMTECVICLEEGNLIRPCVKCSVETHEHCWCVARQTSNQCPVCRTDLEPIHRPGVEAPVNDTNRITRWVHEHPVVVNCIWLVSGIGVIIGTGFMFAEF